MLNQRKAKGDAGGSTQRPHLPEEANLATPVTLRETRRALSLVTGILPADEESSPSIAERLRFIPYVIVPWVLLYAVTAKFAPHGISFGMPFEDRLPILSWTAPIYQSIYVVIALAPWWVRTRRDLRRIMISSWLAMAVVFPFYWLVPSSAPRRALSGHGWITSLLGVERTAFPPIAAFPSFHVLLGDLSWPGLPAPVDGLDLRCAHRGGLHHHRAALHRGCRMFGDDRTRFS